jgi:hypothetical protein
MMAHRVAVPVAVTAPGEGRAGHREAGRDDQCCGERELLHPNYLLLGTHLSVRWTSIAVSRANMEE